MATITVSLYPSEKFKKTDLTKLMAVLEHDIKSDLKIFGFEAPTVSVEPTGLFTSGNSNQVLLSGLSGLVPEKLRLLFWTIKSVFGGCLAGVEDVDVIIVYSEKVVSD